MKKNEPSFKIVLESHLILLKMVGAPGVELVKEIRDETAQMLKQKNAPQDILVRTNGLGMLGPKAFYNAVQGINAVPFRRVAICGNLPSGIGTAKTLVKSSEKTERIKIFRNEEDARAWLKEEAQPIRSKLKHQTNKLKPINKTSLGQFILGVVLITPN